MSRTVLVLVAVGAAVIAGAVGVAWRVKKDDQAAIAAIPAAGATPATVSATPHPAQSAEPARKQAAASAPALTAAPAIPAAPAASAAAAPAATPARTSPAPAAAVMAPSFDVARIGADGRAVIAGRAAPNARVVLLDGGKEIARGEADARGEWVILLQDPPLASGQHELRAVHHIEGRAPVTSEQVVVAVVPAPVPAGRPKDATTSGAPAAPDTRREDTMVLLVPPSGAATLMQSPSRAGVPRSSDLQVSTMGYDQHGQTTITGQATPGATVRAYLDDKVVAEGTAGPDGRWKMAPAQPIGPGQHTLRLDRLAPDGKPTARLELPFARLDVAAVAGDNTRRLYVVRGDNLWNIARAHYGEGWRHTMIFEANKDQIRNPHLIYPGQVFSLPKVN
ncbi:LysM peptidoglycan-binding domain-containing protein [Reyranella sp.]|uniref:LysM peptidoglycan-binding domain-containing protein n=1 Tax=Reyranella sp. TaxID=1929291 RepID=UPI003D0E8838